MKILHIDSSPMLKHSSSRKLSQALVEALCQRYSKPQLFIATLAWRPHPICVKKPFWRFAVKRECENAQIQQEVNDIHAAIDELASCDVLIIGAPMINHSVSSGLKTG